MEVENIKEKNKNELHNKWVLWFHHVNDDNWGEESYMKIHEIETIEDYWKVMNTISTFTAGIFFLMKEDIFPRQEDINNIDGGIWSFKVSKKDADANWRMLIMKVIGRTIVSKDEDNECINGLSISPKINNCILKIWNNNSKNNNINILNGDNLISITLRDGIYRRHQEN